MLPRSGPPVPWPPTRPGVRSASASRTTCRPPCGGCVRAATPGLTRPASTSPSRHTCAPARAASSPASTPWPSCCDGRRARCPRRPRRAGCASGRPRGPTGCPGRPTAPRQRVTAARAPAAGFARLDSLPPELAATVRLRVGLPVAAEEVLAGAPVRDRWQVLGVRDEPENDLMVRRVWLRGAQTGRAALVLSFAGPGQVFVTDLVPGTALDADLCFYPEHLRVLIARRHAPAAPLTTVGAAVPVAAAMREYAEALAADPWLERWPMVLAGVTPARAADRWCLTAGDGEGVPLDRAVGAPWRLVAAAAGRPVTVAGEWTAAGLRPLSVWVRDRLVPL